MSGTKLTDLPIVSSDEGAVFVIRAPETWRVSGEMRWIKRTAYSGDLALLAAAQNAPLGAVIPLAPGERFPTQTTERILQQRWVRLDAPGEEWRDVPTVEG